MGKVKHSDLVEENVFQPTIQQAQALVQVLGELKIGFKDLLETTKQQAKTNTFENFTDVKKAAEAMEQAKQAAEGLKKAEDQLRVATEQLERAKNGEIDATVKAKVETQQANAEVRRLAKEQSSLTTEYQKQSATLNNLRKQYKDLVLQEKGATKEAKDLLKQITSLDKKLKDVDASVGQHQRNVGNYSSAFSGLKGAVTSSISSFIGWGAAVMGAVKLVKDAVKAQKELEQALSELKAITDASAEDLKFYRAEAKQVGATWGVMAKDVVKAYQLVGSAKSELLDNREALAEVTKQAIILAKASGLEVPEAAKRLTDAMNQFNIPAEKAGETINILAEGAKLGAAEVPDLTDAVLKAGSAAKVSNISLAETTAVLEAFAERGIKGAEAGTQLRNVFLKMTAVRALPRKALEELKAAGVNLEIMSNTALPLKDRLQELSKVQGNAAAITKIFGVENFNAASILIDNREKVEELTQALGKEGLTTAIEQAEIQMQTLEGATDQFNSTLNSVLAGEGNVAGFFTALIKGATDALIMIDNLGLQMRLLTSDIDELSNKDLSTLLKVGETDSGKKIAKFLQPFEQINDWDFQKSAWAFKHQFVGALIAEGEKAEEAGILFDQYIRERTTSWIESGKKQKESSKKTSNEIIEITQELTEKEKKELEKRLKEQLKMHQDYMKLLIGNMKENLERRIAEERFYHEQQLIELKDNHLALEQEQIRHEREIRKIKDEEIKTIDALGQEEIKSNKEVLDENFKKTQEAMEADKALKDKKAAEDKTRANIELKEKQKDAAQLQKLAEEGNKFLEEKSQERLTALDKEAEASKQRQDELRQLAIAGDKDAQASIAAEDKRQAQIQLQKEKEAQKAKRRELALTAINTYNAKVQAGDENALGSTIRDLTLLAAAIQAIPGFYEGTENVSSSLGKPQLAGRDGYVVRVDGSERVVDGANNSMIGTMSNDMLAEVANMYNKGLLIPATRMPAFVSNSTDLSELTNKLEAIERNTANFPQYSAHYDTIDHAVTEIVKRGHNIEKTKTKLRNRIM